MAKRKRRRAGRDRAPLATPDSQMDRPVANLLWAAASLVERVRRYAHDCKPGDTARDVRWFRALERDYLRREDELRHAYATAIRARAGEIAQYCRHLGLADATERLARDEPFLLACAVRRALKEREP